METRQDKKKKDRTVFYRCLGFCAFIFVHKCLKISKRRMKSRNPTRARRIQSAVFHPPALLLEAHLSLSYPPSFSIIIHHTQVASQTELACCLRDLSLMLLLPATRCNICEIGGIAENPRHHSKGSLIYNDWYKACMFMYSWEWNWVTVSAL